MIGKVLFCVVLLVSATYSLSIAENPLDGYRKCDPTLKSIQCVVIDDSCSGCSCGTAINRQYEVAAGELIAKTCASYTGGVCRMFCPAQEAVCSSVGVCVLRDILPTITPADQQCKTDADCTEVPSQCSSCCGAANDTPVSKTFAEAYLPIREEACTTVADNIACLDVLCSAELARSAEMAVIENKVVCKEGYCSYDWDVPVDPIEIDRSCSTAEDCTVVASECPGCCGEYPDTPMNVKAAETFLASRQCPLLRCVVSSTCMAPEKRAVTCSAENVCVFDDPIDFPPVLDEKALYCNTAEDCTYVPSKCPSDCCGAPADLLVGSEFALSYQDAYKQACPPVNCEAPTKCPEIAMMVAEHFCVDNMCTYDPPIACFVDPCEFATCSRFPGALCSADKSCNPVFTLKGVEVNCDPIPVRPLDIPSDYMTCKDASECIPVNDGCNPCVCQANYAASINAQYLDKYNAIVAETCDVSRMATSCPSVMCPMMYPMPYCVEGKCSMTSKPLPPPCSTVSCFADPCSVSSCPAFPKAECKSDFCGGCNARFFIGSEDVTDKCVPNNCWGLECDACGKTNGCAFCTSSPETATSDSAAPAVDFSRCMPAAYQEKCNVVGSFSSTCPATPIKTRLESVAPGSVIDENTFNAELDGVKEGLAKRFLIVVSLILRDTVKDDKTNFDLVQMFIDITGDGLLSNADKTELCTMLGNILAKTGGVSDSKLIKKCEISTQPVEPAPKRASSTTTYVAELTVDNNNNNPQIEAASPLAVSVGLLAILAALLL